MALSWIGIDAEGTMSVNPRAASNVLEPLGEQEPLNLVAVFGAARQGKSFLMNCLMGREGTFRISNARDPCTEGIDISRTTLPLASFAALSFITTRADHSYDDEHDDDPRGGDGGGGGAPAEPRVAFVDAEGQGDRDVNYDARLASPVLLSSRVVLFNWKDALQRDRIIQALGVVVKAAANIDVGSDTDGDGARGGGNGARGGARKFGHLHIVFRDWTFEVARARRVASRFARCTFLASRS